MGDQDKKASAIHIYHACVGKGMKTQEAYDLTAQIVHRSNRWVADTVRLWKAEQRTKVSQRGAFSKVKSPMDDPKFRKDLTDFVEVNSLRRGQKNLTCEDVLDWVREYFDIGVDEEQPYDVRTMNNWLHQLGFVRKSAHKKVTYFDGHEDEKNIEDRKRLWNELKQYEGKILEIDKQTLELKNEDTMYK